MSTKDDSKKEVSKIEQIKINLEKRLAAIEEEKLKASEKVEKEIEETVVPVASEIEILKKTEKPKETEEIKIKETKKAIIPLKDNKKEIPNKKTKSKIPVKPIDKEEEEESKKGFLIYFIYFFLLLIFITIGFYAKDYLNEDKILQQEKTNQKLTEFNNKRISDSIVLASLNNPLLDLQTKKNIDSIAKVYENELIAEAKLKNKSTKLNYDSQDFTSPENITIINDVKKPDTDPVNTEIETETETENTIEKVTESKSTATVASTKTKSSQTSDYQFHKKNTPILQDTKKSKLKESKSKEIISISPIHPKCKKKKTDREKKLCLSDRLSKDFSKKIRRSVIQNSGLPEGIYKILTTFVIDRNGYATATKINTKNEKIIKEAIRLVKDLPKMEPGTINGKKSDFTYHIPIQFRVD